jgi:hypothetical protein
MADIKRKEILAHATTWIDFQDIVQSEASQLQKDKYCTIPLGSSSSSQNCKERMLNDDCQGLQIVLEANFILYVYLSQLNFSFYLKT